MIGDIWPKPTDEASVFRYHPAFKYGIPQTDQLRLYEGYVASFDQRTRNPKWVLEFITKESLIGDGAREQSNFYEDPGLEPRFRSKLDDYSGSGYDRGHMAPAANHRASQKAMNDTFSLSNISPQVGPGFNRDYWARFEKFVKDVAKVSDGVFIVTGPLWLPQPDGRGKWEMRHPVIGQPPQMVSVPTHYYKVILAENTSGQNGQHRAAVGAFVMPNAAIDPQTPVTAFTVPLESLEGVAGAKFFPGFVNDRRRAALDEAALGWQAEGKARLKVFDRVNITQDQAALLPLNGEGAVHLCDLVACQMPLERWWDNGSRGGGKGGGSSGRSLPRQKRSSGIGSGNPQEVAVVADMVDTDVFGDE
eukprot:gene11483-11627_t